MEEVVRLDVADIKNFRYDTSRCIRCKGCKWVDHIYMPGRDFSTRCPSEMRYLFDSYTAYGRLKLALGLMEGKISYSPRLLDAIYKCTLCGACDVGCKRNLDMEILLSLEALRIKCVEDGKGPLPSHKEIGNNVKRVGNVFGLPQMDRQGFLSSDIKPSKKADLLYFAGCYASYPQPEISQANLQILKALSEGFLLMNPEGCCGNLLYSTGQLEEAKGIASKNIEAIRNSKVKVLLTSCAECYRMIKVDYPKIFNLATADLGFKVVHVVEYVEEKLKEGKIRLLKPINLRVTYHDSCSLARCSEPWLYWEGKRGKWGIVNPPLVRRRGTYGIYHQPRNILRSIPGIDLVEMVRIRENSWCCGGGRGVLEAFPDFAIWTALERLKEVSHISAEAIVSACPRCKENFTEAIKTKGEGIKVYDISELISEAIG